MRKLSINKKINYSALQSDKRNKRKIDMLTKCLADFASVNKDGFTVIEKHLTQMYNRINVVERRLDMVIKTNNLHDKN
jgi:hypothetical protein